MSIESYPAGSEVEITVIGTGGGYGESIVIHLGNRNWIVIDCCVSPNKENLPIKYLNSIGVDLATEVKMIVCTHWHDDHIKGISMLVEQCESANLCFGPCHDSKKFLRLVSLDYQKGGGKVSASSTKEFNRCIEILEHRRKDPVRAISDRILLTVEIDTVKASLITLSPSDHTLTKFDEEISMLLDAKNFGSRNRRLIIDKPNDKSVALLLRFGNNEAILGGDLEVGTDERAGWLPISARKLACFAIDTKSSYFKIPHHGSENGYHREIWDRLLTPKPLSTLTTYSKNEGLPTKEMVDLYKDLAGELYITASASSKFPSKRSRSIKKILDDFKIVVETEIFTHGIIRSRINCLVPDAVWAVETFGTAEKL